MAFIHEAGHNRSGYSFWRALGGVMAEVTRGFLLRDLPSWVPVIVLAASVVGFGYSVHERLRAVEGQVAQLSDLESTIARMEERSLAQSDALKRIEADVRDVRAAEAARR